MVTCMATHYEGDPCDNTKKFFKWMKKCVKEKETSLLKGMDFAVFGLGDRSYELFNEMGVHFDKTFATLGGNRVHELGAANAETFSTEEDFFDWKCKFWPAVVAHYAKSCTEVREKKVEVSGVA
jgi:NADPH-ferrihemoprotein reductase